MGESRILRTQCGKCGSNLRVKTHAAEKVVTCPKCGSRVTVSGTAIPVPPPPAVAEAERRSDEFAGRIEVAKRNLARAATTLAIVIVWSLVFSAAALFFLQKPIEPVEGGKGKVVLYALLGAVLWMGVFAALLSEQYWAIGVAFCLGGLGVVLGVSVVFSGPLLVTPEWPTYVGLLNGIALVAVAGWGLVVTDKYNKLRRKVERQGIREIDEEDE